MDTGLAAVTVAPFAGEAEVTGRGSPPDAGTLVTADREAEVAKTAQSRARMGRDATSWGPWWCSCDALCPDPLPSGTARLAVVLSTNQFKNGNHIEVDGTIFKIVDFQHVKPGKGGAFVRTKLRRASDGNVIDRTFRAGEKFRSVRTESRKMQFLYADGSDAHMMDSESFEQIAIAEGAVSDALRWMTPSSEVDVLFIDDVAADVQLPSAVELAVSQTDPGLRGDSVSGGGTKPATLETGTVIQVPLFVEQGERVRVDTRSGEYVARA
jgi:elongation factor P